MVSNRDARKKNDDAAATEPGYLFHMQRQPGSADARPAATRWIATGKRKPPSSGHSQDILMSNMRRFIIFVGAMTVFFLIAMFVAKKTWQMKQASSSSPPSMPPETTVLKSSASISAERSGRIDSTPEGDSETVRQATMLTAQGDALQASGQYKEAIELYGQALALWPGLSKVRAKLGRTYLRVQNYPAAQAALERAVENTPGAPDLINDLGVAHYQQRRYERALRLFESAAQIDSSFSPAYYNLGLCRLARGDREGAMEALTHYLELKPDDARALKERAFLLAAAGDYTNAMGSLKAALAASPDWPPLYFDAAATAALMGRAEDAILYLKKAQELTSPATVNVVYKQPAFQEIRQSDAGKAFGEDLANAAKNRTASGETEARVSYAVEPIVSSPL